MKLKQISLLACMLLATFLSTSAQTAAVERPVNPSVQARNGQTVGSYSFQLFIAPNKSFGYDILSNNKTVYHQPAFSGPYQDSNLMLTKKEQANLAAILAIEKIKKGISPQLSRNELIKITAR